MSLFLTQRRYDGKVYPIFTYQYQKKRTRIYSGVNCDEKWWNSETKKITRGDSEYKVKNLKIKSLGNRIQEIINRYETLGEILLPQQLKLELEGREKIREAKSIRNLPLLSLVEDWEEYYLSDKEILHSTKSKTKSIIKDIKTYIREVQSNEKLVLGIDDLDKEFNRDFMNWLFNKETRNGVGLQPHSVDRRFQYLSAFCKWFSIQSKEFKKCIIPKEIKDAKSISNDETPICFYDSELEKLFNFRGFDFMKSITREDGKIDWIESEDYEKYLTKDRQNRNKKGGVLELIHEETKYGLQTYTSYEIYKDLMVFLCSCGARYGDGVNMRVGDFKHSKRNPKSTLDEGVEAFFTFYQKKTNSKATPRVNEISFEIFKKYSRGKTKSDFLFPRTSRGNTITDVKFNKHIKIICKILGFDRKVIVRKLGSRGKELSRKSIPLHDLISSHTGRKTFIKTLVLNGNYSTPQIMAQTGHKSEKSFSGYYKIEEKDLLLQENSLFLQKRNNYRIKSNNKSVEKIDVQLEPFQQLKSLKEKLRELEEVREMISDKEYKSMRNKIIKNPF